MTWEQWLNEESRPTEEQVAQSAFEAWQEQLRDSEWLAFIDQHSADEDCGMTEQEAIASLQASAEHLYGHIEPSEIISAGEASCIFGD
jgi:hypothetical protein